MKSFEIFGEMVGVYKESLNKLKLIKGYVPIVWYIITSFLVQVQFAARKRFMTL